jgi:hypothetical protein
MIALAIKLSQADIADCWDDVDRYTRNQFAEMQLLRRDWIDRMIEPLPQTPVDETKHATSDRVVERNIGACLMDLLPNEGFDTAGCCTGNYARAIPYIWDNIQDLEEGALKVNLLLNRASPWADVESYVPYEGRVDIKVKQACKLSVRIPEWVHPEETACRVNGQARKLRWKDRYAQIGQVDSGDIVALVFPITERTVKEKIGGVNYTLIIKGNTVVSINPPGKHYTFYQRAHYRENSVRWVKRPRFVWSRPLLQWPY